MHLWDSEQAAYVNPFRWRVVAGNMGNNMNDNEVIGSMWRFTIISAESVGLPSYADSDQPCPNDDRY